MAAEPPIPARKRPLATARVEIVVWENARPDGSRFVVIDVAGLARFFANVNPDAEARGIPYAVGRGVTVWLNRSSEPHARPYFRIKCNRFKEPFRVFPCTPMPPQAGTPDGPRASAPVAPREA